MKSPDLSRPTVPTEYKFMYDQMLDFIAKAPNWSSVISGIAAMQNLQRIAAQAQLALDDDLRLQQPRQEP